MSIRTIILGIVVIGALFYISKNPAIGSQIGGLISGLFTAAGNLLASFSAH